MSGYMLGTMLKDNLMAGRPSRMKAYSDYTGLVVPPCGQFTPSSTSPARPPWMPAQTNIGSSRRMSLHREIKHFTAYIKPTSDEVALRTDLVTRFTRLLRKLAPTATVQAVGSSVTGLCFPTSDIDMVITFSNQRYGPMMYLRELEGKIRTSGFSSKIESILNASVPLLRITDAVTGIEIDLTAADGHGVKATQAVERWMRENDPDLIKTLVMVLKMFLSIRMLGTTYTGGVNSYVLVWMVVAWVKLEMPGSAGAASSGRRRSSGLDEIIAGMGSLSVMSSTSAASARVSSSTGLTSTSSQDLGTALLGFLRFWGQDFDYANKAIQFTSTGVRYASKYASYTSLGHRAQQYLLSISDPADPAVEMGSKIYGIKHVQETFRDAYSTLLSLSEGTATRSKMEQAKVLGVLGVVMGGDFTHFISKRGRLVGS